MKHSENLSKKISMNGSSNHISHACQKRRRLHKGSVSSLFDLALITVLGSQSWLNWINQALPAHRWESVVCADIPCRLQSPRLNSPLMDWREITKGSGKCTCWLFWHQIQLITCLRTDCSVCTCRTPSYIHPEAGGGWHGWYGWSVGAVPN